MTAQAHSGGLDSNGCHAGSQPYHCHRAPSDMVGNRLRCDLGSRSSECNNDSTGTVHSSREPSSDPYRGLLENQETSPSQEEYIYLNCTEGRSTYHLDYGYIRVTPEKSVADLDKFYEWNERPTSVDLDYYEVKGAFKISRSSLVMEAREWNTDLDTMLFEPAKYKKVRCEPIQASEMEEIRLKLIADKKSKQRI